jgi:hypothetical protein
MIGKKRNYNETHPELREGEMHLSNCPLDSYSYDRIGWNTKRRGQQAYTIDGKLITRYIPVFVQREEYEKGMKKYKEEEK